MNGIALKDLLEAGVHFGHQTKRWNPKMKAYIFGERNWIYIIDLAKTAKLFRDAEQFTMNLAAEGHTGWDAARGELEIAFYVEVETRGKRLADVALGEIDRSYLDALRKIKGKVDQAAEIARGLADAVLGVLDVQVHHRADPRLARPG